MAKRNDKGKKGKKGGGVPKTNLERRLSHTAVAGPTAEVNDGNFDRVVNSQTPTLVDFWAPWCGPCKVMSPILEQVAAERRGALRIVKYNTEANNQIASRLNVRSIPTLALFVDGQVLDVKVGAMKKPALEAWLDGALQRAA